ncbi:hypothetical protein [Propionicicella superfundia]|nr:hypothetical protein [Propionicicella superfundia]
MTKTIPVLTAAIALRVAPPVLASASPSVHRMSRQQRRGHLDLPGEVIR